MTKIKFGSMAAVLAAGLLALVPAGAQTIRFGHANAPGEVANDMFNELAERVNKRTNRYARLLEEYEVVIEAAGTDAPAR